MYLIEFLLQVSDTGLIDCDQYRPPEEELKNSFVKISNYVAEHFATGGPFVSLFVQQAPSKLKKSLVVEVNKKSDLIWVTKCDVSPFFTPAGFTFSQVRDALFKFADYLKPYAVACENVPQGFVLQLCNEVVGGRRTYSVHAHIESDKGKSAKATEEIAAYLKANPVLDALMQLAATRLRSIGRWSWTNLGENDLYGYCLGPAFEKLKAQKNLD